MCKSLFGGGQPSMPAIAPIAPAPEPLKNAEERISTAKSDTRRRAAALASMSASTLTSPLGLGSAASVSSKSLLGQ